MNERSINRRLTVAETAELFGVDEGKVLRWIATGELRAVNVAQNCRGGRPRWRITPEDIQRFEMRRANVIDTTPVAKPVRQRQRQPPKPEGYIEYV